MPQSKWDKEIRFKKFEITVKLVLKFMKIYKECASMHINDLVNLFQNLFREIMTAIRYNSISNSSD